MANIPGQKNRRFYERQAVTEGLAVVPPIFAAGYTIFAALANPQLTWVWPFLVFAIVWLIIASIVKVAYAQKRDAETKSLDQHDGLQGALHVLRASVAERSGMDPNDGSLRVTIHRVVPPLDAPESLEQLLPYIGGNGGPPYRRFPIRAGIIGKVARENAAYVHTRKNDDYEAFLKEMVRDWGYTEADAKGLNREVRTSMAVPVFSPEKVVEAVIYLDSTKKDVFDDAAKATVINGCKGIAAYIRQRYQ